MNLKDLAEYSIEAQKNDIAPTLRSFRDEEFERFQERGFPVFRSEDWRYTNTKSLQNLKDLKPLPVSPRDEDRKIPPNTILFEDGCFYFDDLPRGLKVILDEKPKGLHLHSDNSLIHLNGALLTSHLTVVVEPNADVELELRFAAKSSNLLPARFEIQVGANARLQLLESLALEIKDNKDHQGVSGSSFVSICNKMELGPGAGCDHTLLCRGQSDEHLTRASEVRVGRDAHYVARYLSLAGGWARHDISVHLDGAGAHADLAGLYMGRAKEHVDFHIATLHHAAHSNSHQLFKGVLADQARTVFCGQIRIDQDAQEVDSSLLNKNLVLSDEAEVNTKPELEIEADNVKAAHGATVGQLNEEEVFYLQSRGISPQQARRILTLGFLDEVILAIPHPSWQVQCLSAAHEVLEGQLQGGLENV